MPSSFTHVWDLMKMPVVPGSLELDPNSPSYEWRHPKRKQIWGRDKVEEGDDTSSSDWDFHAEHTDHLDPILKPYQQRYPPINISIQNYTDAWEDGRPQKGREMALHGAMGELFAYRDNDGNYRVYDGASLSQGEGRTAANQVGAWDGEPLFDAYDTDFGRSPAPGWGRPDETPKRISRRMELLEVMATALSQAHPNAKLFPYRGDSPVAPNPELFKKSWDLMKMPYHGTTTDVLPQIMREGIQPQRANQFLPPLVFYSDDPDAAISYSKIRSDERNLGDPVLLHFPSEAIKNPSMNEGMGYMASPNAIPPEALQVIHGPKKPRARAAKQISLDRLRWDEWSNKVDEWRKEMMRQHERGELS